MGHLFLFLIRLVVCHFKTVLATAIGRALDLIPQVALAGHTVTVHIHTHHDDAGFATAACHVGHGIALERVTIDSHVIAMLVDDGMVKAEHDIATVTAQADRSSNGLATQRFLNQGIDAVLSISGLVGGRLVHELPRCGQIVIHMSDVRRILGIHCESRHYDKREK